MVDRVAGRRAALDRRGVTRRSLNVYKRRARKGSSPISSGCHDAASDSARSRWDICPCRRFRLPRTPGPSRRSSTARSRSQDESRTVGRQGRRSPLRAATCCPRRSRPDPRAACNSRSTGPRNCLWPRTLSRPLRFPRDSQRDPRTAGRRDPAAATDGLLLLHLCRPHRAGRAGQP